MKNAICLTKGLFLFLLCASMAVQAQAEGRDLEDYLGASMEEVTADFPDLTEPGWASGVTATYNDWLYAGSMLIDENQEEIRIIYLKQAHEDWTICGLQPGQSEEEQEQILEERNYQKIWENSRRNQNLYFNGENRFITTAPEGNGEICLHEIQFGPHTDKQELFTCLGMTMAEISQMLSGLEMRTEDEKVILEKEGVSFEGTCEAGMIEEETLVSSITISGSDGEYCLYGLMPGDEREAALYMCFPFGGSGEYTDPRNAVLYLGSTETISLTYWN